MEHLISPPNAEPILVPYLETEDYDGGDFFDYPTRKGWSSRDLEGIARFGGRSERKVEAFFQTWLYFGCLISVFGIAGISVTTRDFISMTGDGAQVINTERFEGLVREWMNMEGMEDSFNSYLTPNHNPALVVDKEARKVRGDLIRAVLDRVLEFVHRYCNTSSWEQVYSYGIAPPFWPISPKLSMCIMAIGGPLTHVTFEIYGHPRYQCPHWGSSPFLHDQLLEAGWCPRDIPPFGDGAEVDCDYYFAKYGPFRQYMDHSKCTKNLCLAINVDNSTYKTRHAKGCPEVDCPFVHSPEDTIAEIIKAGHIPIVSYRDNELRVEDWDGQGNGNYIAISHVWSDGMGNTEANALPRCQLLRTQSMVYQATEEFEMHESDNPPVEDESDTFLQAISDASDTETKDMLRDFGREVTPYRPVAEQCGFWIDTLCIPVSKKLKKYRNDAIAMMAQIYGSAHQVLVIDAFIREVPRTAPEIDKLVHLYLSSWHRRLWTLQEGLLAQRLLYQFSDGPQTILDMLVRDENDISPRTFYSNVKSSCFLNFYPFYSMFREQFQPGIDDIVTRFYTFTNQTRFRATTKARDEPVCLGTVLGLNVKEMIEESDDHDVRMKHFYKLARKFDSRILFNNFPRLPIPGFRWAPQSFIGRVLDVVNLHDHEEKITTVLDGGGLIVEYPGVKLESPPSATPIRFATREDPSAQYELYLKAEETGKTPAWDVNASYYIISADQLWPGKTGQVSEAVIGVFLEQDEQGRICVEHVARARIQSSWGQKEADVDETSPTASGSSPNTSSPCIWGRWLDPTQKWVVF